MIRSHVLSVLKGASSQVQAAIRGSGGNNTSVSEGVEASVIYVRFKAAASEVTLMILLGRTQCTRLPLYAGSGRGECRLALPPFMERLLPSLEPETYRSWANALAIPPT
ncbi:unnamed protein product [Malus baccata var. baccata]